MTDIWKLKEDIRDTIRAELSGEYDNMLFIADPIDEAFPPTGEYDRSFAGTFKMLALDYGGLRPELSMTTTQRLQEWMGDKYEVKHVPEQHAFHIRRLAREAGLEPANAGFGDRCSSR